MAGVPAEERRQMTWNNVLKLYGLDPHKIAATVTA